MSSDICLVIFDVDGTLIDSQASILASMKSAFTGLDLPVPTREETLSVVGLSLPVVMARLAPEQDAATQARLVEGYKAGFNALRHSGGGDAISPLYPQALEVLEKLAARDEIFLGIATGKSRRGLDHLFDLHGFGPIFHTVQVADDHPSKPHPSMVETCLKQTGVAAQRAVIVGDTTYDIEMGRAAGIHALGVNWGYHSAEMLMAAGARQVLPDFGALPDQLDEIWSET